MAMKNMEDFKKRWNQYFNEWRAADGGLTMAAVDGLHFLYWACSNPEQALALARSEDFYDLEPWEQDILLELEDVLQR